MIKTVCFYYEPHNIKIHYHKNLVIQDIIEEEFY